MADRGDEIMSVDLRAAAADYLAMRRSRGYRLVDHDWLLAAFLDGLDAEGRTTIVVADALAFATAPLGTTRRWHATRLRAVRGLAGYVHALDPAAAQLIPEGLITAKTTRRIPYLYSDEQIAALMAAAMCLSPAPFALTMHTLIGLLAAAGLRGGEAGALDVEDLDTDREVLTVTGKYGKKRLVPLHPTTVRALIDYRQARMGRAALGTGPLLLGTRGRRLNMTTARAAFRTVVENCRLPARPGAGTPHLHDLRHAHAVNSLIDALRDGLDVDARIAALATYLGHVDPASTYWYLTASPELMALVRDRASARHDRGRG